MNKEQILEIFQKTGGVLKGHFLLTSGRHADTYMQCAKLFVHPSESKALCGELAKKLVKYNADLVISPALGGIIMGYEVAAQLGVSNVFAERVDGKMELRRGFEIKAGARIIAVEDVVTTGGSVKEVIALARELGGEVVAAAAIVDRSAGSVPFDVPFESLLSMEIPSYEESACPICASGAPLVKPGSRVKK